MNKNIIINIKNRFINLIDYKTWDTKKFKANKLNLYALLMVMILMVLLIIIFYTRSAANILLYLIVIITTILYHKMSNKYIENKNIIINIFINWIGFSFIDLISIFIFKLLTILLVYVLWIA